MSPITLPMTPGVDPAERETCGAPDCPGIDVCPNGPCYVPPDWEPAKPQEPRIDP